LIDIMENAGCVCRTYFCLLAKMEMFLNSIAKN